jgi:hypothetical protein
MIIPSGESGRVEGVIEGRVRSRRPGGGRGTEGQVPANREAFSLPTLRR